MKVFYIGRYNQSEFLTGPEKVAKRIFTEFTNKNESVFIEYFFDGRKYGLMKKLFGSEVVDNMNSSKVLRLGIFKLFFFLLKQKPTTIHIITFERFAIVSLFYRLFSKTKIIYGLQGISYYENIKYKNVSLSYIIKDKICEKLLFMMSSKLVFLSERSIEIAANYFNFNHDKVEIISNGVDEIFHSSGNAKTFSNSGNLKIVFIGDIERNEKGFNFLSSALKKINFPFELYLLCNTKKFTENNFKSVAKLDTKALSEFLLDKDVYISSSEYEPFSIAAAECVCEGLVSIVTEETGMSRYIKNGENGFTVKYNDVTELARLLDYLNSNKNLFPGISEAGEKIYEEVSWPAVLKKYQKLYI